MTGISRAEDQMPDHLQRLGLSAGVFQEFSLEITRAVATYSDWMGLIYLML